MAALAGAGSVSGKSGRKPNFLFLIADDHAGYVLGADGNKLARTRTSTGSPRKEPGSPAITAIRRLHAVAAIVFHRADAILGRCHGSPNSAL